MVLPLAFEWLPIESDNFKRFLEESTIIVISKWIKIVYLKVARTWTSGRRLYYHALLYRWEPSLYGRLRAIRVAAERRERLRSFPKDCNAQHLRDNNPWQLIWRIHNHRANDGRQDSQFPWRFFFPHLNIAETLWRVLKGKWIRQQDNVSTDTLFYATNRALADIGNGLCINYIKHAVCFVHLLKK